MRVDLMGSMSICPLACAPSAASRLSALMALGSLRGVAAPSPLGEPPADRRHDDRDHDGDDHDAQETGPELTTAVEAHVPRPVDRLAPCCASPSLRVSPGPRRRRGRANHQPKAVTAAPSPRGTEYSKA